LSTNPARFARSLGANISLRLAWFGVKATGFSRGHAPLRRATTPASRHARSGELAFVDLNLF